MKWSFQKILINWWKTPPEDAHKPVKTGRILPLCGETRGGPAVPPSHPSRVLWSAARHRLPRRDLPRCRHSRDGARTRSAPEDHVPAARAHLHTGTALYRWLKHKVTSPISPAPLWLTRDCASAGLCHGLLAGVGAGCGGAAVRGPGRARHPLLQVLQRPARLQRQVGRGVGNSGHRQPICPLEQ